MPENESTSSTSALQKDIHMTTILGSPQPVDVEMEDADLDETTPPDEDDEYWDGLEPLPEDPDDPESLTDPYKEEVRYDAILKMVSAVK